MPTPIRMRFQTISIMSSGWVVPGAELRDEIGRRNDEENLRMYQERESRTICTLGGRLRLRCFAKTEIRTKRIKKRGILPPSPWDRVIIDIRHGDFEPRIAEHQRECGFPGTVYP